VSNRWWGPRSDFPWEEDALKHIQGRMPLTEPYRAWQTFTFTAQSGHVREVDLFTATPAGLFLVEIKSHPGRATNDGGTWLFRGERIRTIENPLHLTDLKTKELRQQLQWAADKLGLKLRVPRIQPAVFLSAPDLRCEFDEVQRVRVFGRDDLAEQTGLPGIWSGLLGKAPSSASNRVDATFSRQLDKLRQQIGVQGLRKHRRVGPFELDPKAFDDGPTWVDFLAKNTALHDDQPRRIRIYLSELGATRHDRESTRRAARREYLALQGISHEGIVQAEQYSDEHEGGPSIVFRHGKDWQRLDYFMAEHGAGLPVETRVEMVRQLAEAVDHAHRRHLYHRALAARSVYVEMDGRYPRLRICDWQVSARPTSGSSGRPTALDSSGSTSLSAHIEGAAGAYLAPEFGNAEAQPTQLDVFGLGALSHLVLTGIPPAANRKALFNRLSAESALVPSAVSDDVSPNMDDLIRSATAVQPVDRYESIRDFLTCLEVVEDEVTAPDDKDLPDLLEATRGAVVGDWQIVRILGKGSTAKALLATKNGYEQVLKVALNDGGRRRLFHEADQLRDIKYAHIVRYIDGPIQIGERWVLILEQAGQQTLTQYLRHEGRLTIDDLENLGDQLFQAARYLEDQEVWHRDIKPDNLAIREMPKRSRRLVLFDFSLAGAADRDTQVGTAPYLDPFLGTDRRPVYDAAAERYTIAVTLHEMASAELPSWGDSVVEPRLLPKSVQLPQLAEDAFDPLLRARLVTFFHTALHRDPAKRHSSLKDMQRAWSDVFRALDETPPATTSHTVHERPADAAEAREVSAANVTAGTLLVAAGLSARALSAALQQLDVSTVGELVAIPAARIQRLRGVGLGPRNELVKRAGEWRRQLELSERTEKTAGTEPVPTAEDLTRLSLDEVAETLVPKGREINDVRVIRAVLALPDADGRPAQVAPWAPLTAVAEDLGLSLREVGDLLGDARKRWARGVKAITALRATVRRVLVEHGRVMEAGQLAAALLGVRGSALDDPATRLALAGACVRAAVEAEEYLEDPRLAWRRNGTRILIASVADDDPSAPSEEELLDYAVELGAHADELVRLSDAAPLPGVGAVRLGLQAVKHPEGMPPLSDIDLISLAAGASRNAAVTARLELYPRDLDAKKALTQSGVLSHLGQPGIEPGQLRDRVLARFPELARLPAPGQLRTLLREMGHQVEVVTDDRGVTRYVLPGSSGTSVLGTTSSGWRSLITSPSGVSPRAEALRRLITSIDHGGFLAVKAKLPQAAAVRDELRALSGVTPLHVTEVFVAALREIVGARGKPRWETVLAADTADASPAARTGFGRLLDEMWAELDARIRALDGVVLLHDATPLARYTGGMELLTRLAATARQADEPPHGLWLLCPMDDPSRPALLDGQTVSALGENEQVTVPSGVLDKETGRAS
jgi:serine/threonine protein kinase